MRLVGATLESGPVSCTICTFIQFYILYSLQKYLAFGMPPRRRRVQYSKALEAPLHASIQHMFRAPVPIDIVAPPTKNGDRKLNIAAAFIPPFQNLLSFLTIFFPKRKRKKSYLSLSPTIKQPYIDRPEPITFMPVAVDTSGRIYDDFLRLLFLDTHREASALTNDIPEESGHFRFLDTVCLTFPCFFSSTVLSKRWMKGSYL